MDRRRADTDLTAAFREAGIDVDALPPDEAAARINARAGTAGLITALIEGCTNRRMLEPPDEAGAVRLYRIVEAADPDPWGRRAHAAILGNDLAALRELAAAADTDRASVGTVKAVADILVEFGGDFEAALPLLRRLNRSHPDDFWVNIFLGSFLRRSGPDGLEEALRYFTAAVALRPRSAVALCSLGGALRDQGEFDRAAATLRRAENLATPGSPAAAGIARALATTERHRALAPRLAAVLAGDDRTGDAR
jgi:serine/threonine-protein kinase